MKTLTRIFFATVCLLAFGGITEVSAQIHYPGGFGHIWEINSYGFYSTGIAVTFRDSEGADIPVRFVDTSNELDEPEFNTISNDEGNAIFDLVPEQVKGKSFVIYIYAKFKEVGFILIGTAAYRSGEIYKIEVIDHSRN